MAVIHDVASTIIREFSDGISTMKLQKLTFLAHGWSLALRKTPLTEESFVLWSKGPVNKTLQAVHKNQYTVHAWAGNPRNLTRQEAIIVASVIRQYGVLTGPQLAEVVNKKAPWVDLNGTGYRLYDDEIMTHFTNLLVLK